MTTTEVLDRAESFARELATTLGQPALDVAMAAAQAMAIRDLVFGVIAGVGALAVWAVQRWIWNAMEGSNEESRQMVRFFSTLVALMVGLAFAVACVRLAGNAASWIAAFDGGIALALKVLR